MYGYDDYTPVATMGEAHSEWHRNAGVPMGTPGCPQDACHPPDEWEYDEGDDPQYVMRAEAGTAEAEEASAAAYWGAEAIRQGPEPRWWGGDSDEPPF